MIDGAAVPLLCVRACCPGAHPGRGCIPCPFAEAPPEAVELVELFNMCAVKHTDPKSKAETFEWEATHVFMGFGIFFDDTKMAVWRMLRDVKAIFNRSLRDAPFDAPASAMAAARPDLMAALVAPAIAAAEPAAAEPAAADPATPASAAQSEQSQQP